ncbi:MAG: hypothetical protein MK095_07215 [Phycisphaerales bacterium]|nr:hypothetical protein [Phycisphaerales bacterium]
MSHSRVTAPFKLVGEHDAARVRQWNDAGRAVARENVAAAQLNPGQLDPRWTLAKLAYTQLQQGPITPEQRDGLVSKAGHLGLRPFDASLIIAIAQDYSRTGRSLQDAEATLRLVRPPHADEKDASATQHWTMALLLALILSAAVYSLL